jgi:hypothetical protein
MDLMKKIDEKIRPSILKHHQAIFFIISILIIFIILGVSVFIRPYVAGADTYYYLNHTCHGTEIDKPYISTLVFSLIPCDMNLYKMVQIIILLLSVILITLIGIEVDKEYGWLTGIFAFLGLALPYEVLGNLEPQQLALPFILFALWMIVKYLYLNKDDKYIWLSFFAVFISCFIWSGSYIYLFILAALNPLIFMGFIIGGMLFINNVIKFATTLLPNFWVMENLPIIAIIYWTFLVIGVPQMNKLKSELKWIMILFLAIGLLNAKYLIFAIPLLAVGCMLFYRDTIKNKSKKIKAYALFGIVLIVVMFSAIGISKAIPTQDLMQDLTTAHSYAMDNNKIYENDWGLGYYSIYLDYNVKYKGHMEDYYDYNNSIVVSMPNSYIDLDINKSCEKLSITKVLNSYTCN